MAKHVRDWALGIIGTAVLLGGAAMLAASAVPSRDKVAGQKRFGVPASSASTTTADNLVPESAITAGQAEQGAVTTGTAVYGPPERIKSAAEKAIAPLLVVPDDRGIVDGVRSALANVQGRRTSQALALANALDNPGARKLVQWFAYRRINSGVTAETIEAFRKANPNWPEGALLRQRAEEALLLDDASPRTIASFFQDTEPQTPVGHAAIAIVELSEGRVDEARARVRQAWRDGNFGTTVESRLLLRFKNLITEADIKWRLDQHLLDDNRYGRKGRIATIRRMIKRLGPEEAAKAKARLRVWRIYRSRSKRRLNDAVRAIAAIEKRKAAENIALPERKPDPALAQVQNIATDAEQQETTAVRAIGAVETVNVEAQPPSPKPDQPSPATPVAAIDWPYEYHRIQLQRRQGKHQDAWRRLLEAPSDTDQITAPDHWWEERRVNIFNALYKRSFATAYSLAAKPADLGANARNEANFMAGWIAFRFLGELEPALEHFNAFTKSADGPRTRAQSHYWLGRVYDVIGNAEAATQNYQTAAREYFTFYGQLAQQKLNPDQIEIAFPAMPELTPERIDEALNSDILQALRFARLAGNGTIVRRLLRAIGKSKQEPHIYHLAAEFAKSTGDTQMAVRIGKGALFHGVPLTEYAYPTHAFPLYKPLITPPEPAMLYGLARQESEFNTLIKSIVGARGVLQVMPATAYGVCREHNLRCGSRRAVTRRLSRDPSYNATLASAYVSGRLQEFGGSYILTYAGYNAGPGRARYWIDKSGDPRSPDVDPIDWIELIHLEETREYVKKVMANLQIYRARLGMPETALQITKDIERGAF